MYISRSTTNASADARRRADEGDPTAASYVLSGDPGDNNAKLFKAGAMKPWNRKSKAPSRSSANKRSRTGCRLRCHRRKRPDAVQQQDRRLPRPERRYRRRHHQALAGQKLAGKVRSRVRTPTCCCCQAHHRRHADDDGLSHQPDRDQKPPSCPSRWSRATRSNSIRKAEGGINQILLDPIVITKGQRRLPGQDGFYTRNSSATPGSCRRRAIYAPAYLPGAGKRLNAAPAFSSNTLYF